MFEVEEEGPPSPWGQRIARLLIALFLAGFAFALVYISLPIFRTRTYEMDWSSESESLGQETSAEGTHRWQGADAVHLGVGFFASGLLLGTWALALVWSVMFPGPPERKNLTWPEWGLAALSLFWLSLAVLAFFPPWNFRLPSIAFWLTQAGVALLCWYMYARRTGQYSKYAAMSLIVGAIALAALVDGATVGIVMGLLIGLVVIVHLFLLLPSWRAQIF